MSRLVAILVLIAAAPFAHAASTPSCDALEKEIGDRSFTLDDDDVVLDGEDLRLRSGGAELLRIDAARNLTVGGRPVAVPKESRADLDAYVAGYRALGADAERIGAAGGRIALSAVGGLVEVLFTSATMDDYEKAMEAKGAAIEAHADRLCRTIAGLRRTEQALQQRIPAFPNVITRPTTAL